jgi:hypothetical protein
MWAASTEMVGGGCWRAGAPKRPPPLFFELAMSCKLDQTTSHPSHPLHVLPAANGNLNAGSFNGNGAGWCWRGARGAGAGEAAYPGAASRSLPRIWAPPAI